MQENKEASGYGEGSKRFHSGMCYTGTPNAQEYYQRLSYRTPSGYQPYQGPASGQSITAMGVAKGMVMMCTNQRLLGKHHTKHTLSWNVEINIGSFLSSPLEYLPKFNSTLLLTGTYEHSGVVTGTFYPPVATSQDQPSPGYNTPTSRSFMAAYSQSHGSHSPTSHAGLSASPVPQAHYTSSPTTSALRSTDSYQGQYIHIFFSRFYQRLFTNYKAMSLIH